MTMRADDDEQLLDDLRRVTGELDAIPDHVRAAAEAALGWRTIDDELAELLHDSAAEESLAGVRAEEIVRVLSFRGAFLEVEVEVSGSGAERTLIGQLMPARRARVEIRHGAGVTTIEADEHGRFTAMAVPSGNVSLRCQVDVAGHPRALATPWLPI
jgi:hypothetical protein